ncbi:MULTISPECIES: PAS domain-containing protein [unclassified Sphingomonas]|uniref:hybrid sensor histidine kinase/response regulator n=1 Tax=unclassified Sphingomonas TaxID=196159 RepID=UPI00285B6F7D|nr:MULTISPECIES: PAS domain-containing protein [unclassified Sphingomonas]MDR6114681.1 PAS domain S-box-containing protein [Sphingomonas sp. SORGH_AS_0789]MDR6151646.1 PAS domain S-box-containing protein [Sphingomonas sp. SORGH_AS_0742]
MVATAYHPIDIPAGFAAVLARNGEMGRLIATFDWAATPLGPIAAWPQSRRTAIGIMLASTIPMATIWGPEAILLYNAGYAEMAGDRHPAILGSPLIQAWPESSSFHAEVVAAGLSGRALAFRDQAMLLGHRDAPEQHWLDLDYIPIPDEDGAPAGIMATLIDSSTRMRDRQEREAASAAARESEGRFRNVADHAPIIMWLTDAEGHCIYVNRAWTAQTGLAVEQGLDFQWLKALHPDDRAAVEGAFRNATRDRTAFSLEFRLLRADGEHRWAMVTAIPRIDDDGTYMGMVGSVFDTDERRRAEATLRDVNAVLERRVVEALAERKLFADIIDSTGTMVQVLGFDHRYLAINRAAAEDLERIFGTRPQIGQNKSDAMAARPEILSIMRDYWTRALAGEDFSVIQALEDMAGERRHYELRFSPLIAADGTPIGAYQFATDVSERLAAQERLADMEAQLRQSQKMEAVGQLTGGIAHDFNNLLQVVVGNLEMLDRFLPIDEHPRARRAATNAMTGAKRAATLTQRLLAFSRRQPLAPQSVDAVRLVDGLSDLLTRTLGEQVSLVIEAAPDLWPAEADTNQLESAILNLAVNARDAMPHGGTLSITLRNATLDGMTSMVAGPVPYPTDPGDYVAIDVSDTGIGMDRATLGRVFEPFFTTKEVGKGTGLGLSMVYGFAKQSGGQVQIESRPGQGTCVSLFLPRFCGDVASVDAPPAPAIRPDRGSETILVVEDDPDVRAYSTEALRELGYDVLEAEDGGSALALLDAPEASRIALLFSDVVLPGGMTGADLASAARSLHPDLKVLFTTGYARDVIVHGGRLDAGVALITKPFDFADLAARIRAMLDG